MEGPKIPFVLWGGKAAYTQIRTGRWQIDNLLVSPLVCVENAVGNTVGNTSITLPPQLPVPRGHGLLNQLKLLTLTLRIFRLPNPNPAAGTPAPLVSMIATEIFRFLNDEVRLRCAARL